MTMNLCLKWKNVGGSDLVQSEENILSSVWGILS